VNIAGKKRIIVNYAGLKALPGKESPPTLLTGKKEKK
jgi:hypothetical protein